MTEDTAAFLEAVCLRADERGYHGMAENDLQRLGCEALLDCVAVYAALCSEARKRFALAIANRATRMRTVRVVSSKPIGFSLLHGAMAATSPRLAESVGWPE